MAIISKLVFEGQFGKEIVENLEKNTKEIGKICPVCGKRFFSSRPNQGVYCSEDCYKKAKKQIG